mmetsp:Transcript_86540/g.253340  ORF Transcript_86540/g.253340 Transcript_86540/m.253340 type:complete len:364 (+) Transcript_86540:64-1155(+)
MAGGVSEPPGSRPRRQASQREPAWHRRQRALGSRDRMAARLAAALARLHKHHGSAVPRVLRDLALHLSAGQGPSASTGPSTTTAPTGPSTSSGLSAPTGSLAPTGPTASSGPSAPTGSWAPTRSSASTGGTTGTGVHGDGGHGACERRPGAQLAPAFSWNVDAAPLRGRPPWSLHRGRPPWSLRCGRPPPWSRRRGRPGRLGHGWSYVSFGAGAALAPFRRPASVHAPAPCGSTPTRPPEPQPAPQPTLPPHAAAHATADTAAAQPTPQPTPRPRGPRQRSALRCAGAPPEPAPVCADELAEELFSRRAVLDRTCYRPEGYHSSPVGNRSRGDAAPQASRDWRGALLAPAGRGWQHKGGPPCH